MAQIACATTNLSLKQQKPSQSLHESIRPFTILANCFGLLPVDGVTSSAVEDLRFRWISLKTLYSFFFMLQAVLGIVFNLIAFFKKDASGSTLGNFTS